MRGIIRGLALMSVVTSYVVAPLIVFLPLGWWLYSTTHELWYVFIAVGLAFIASMYLVIIRLPKALQTTLKNLR